MSDETEAGRLDEHTAERLLGGAGGHAPLHALLSAAAAPGRPDELAGEDAAVAAFRAAPSRRTWPTRLHRFLSAKVIALVGGGAILLTGGVAYGTGHFPGQSPAPAPSPTRDENTGTGDDSTPATQHSPSPLPSTPPSAPPSGPSTGPSSATEGQHGGPSAPNRPRSTPNPRSTSPHPRGPGNGNATPPAPTPSKSKGHSGTNSGSPRGDNSGNATPGNDQGKPE